MIRPTDDHLTSFWQRLDGAERFFMGTGNVPNTVRMLAADLEREQIAYALVGAMALNAHGYRRETIDVNVLLRPEGLEPFRQRLVGHGYAERFPGTRKSFRNTQTGVAVDFLTTGEYPGDGKPKPVAFPDPAAVAVEIEGGRVIALPTLIELKLASGMTQPSRMRDLADVLDIIRLLSLDESFAEQLAPYVRDKYLTLLRQSRVPDPFQERDDPRDRPDFGQADDSGG